ncbi:MAG: Glycerate dehydrogenase [Chloroflexi bacterium ADurb.Bin325]|nr:MAG: Glycerate dehydrogenase [Chloroflexi bacterium ADurb.Bin325]
MYTILITQKEAEVAAATRAEIARLAPGARVIITDDRDAIAAALPAVDIVAGHLSAAQLGQAVNLRWYQQWGAGADWLARHPELAERDFVLTNASGVHAINISEHIFALLLAFARGLPAAFGAQARGEWQRQGDAVFELAGKTLLLVGVGAIGQRTAHLASAFGLRVWGIRRHPGRAAPGVERMGDMARLHEWLPEADFVVLTIPLTAETRHVIDEAALRRMKRTAYLINIGRGATVDEAALARGLREGWLAGAGLDVFEQEPLPAGSPLWAMPNVIITAHYSGATPEYQPRAMAIFLENLRRFVQGEELQNIVDKRLGY